MKSITNALDMPNEYAIVVQNLVKVYQDKIRALDGISFSVKSGTIFGLLGPNGAGKSTTVKILTTLSRPTSGEAGVVGLDVVRYPDKVRESIGCVAQKSGVDREATGRENLTLQGQLYGMKGSELTHRVDELLDRFGLSDAANRITRTYSGGMQRKLDVAMGLVHRPQVLFLDEPTTGLDPKARSDLWNEIENLVNDEHITILLTTHYLEEADRLAERLAIVDRGRIVVEGTPDELKSELHGDAIHIELSESQSDGTIENLFNQVSKVRDVVIEGRLVHARADHGASSVPALLNVLDAEGIKVASVTVARPSLDDVYLRYTGHAYHHEEKNEVLK